MAKDLAMGAGNLFRVSADLRESVMLKNTSISNGMAWSADHSRFYYIDSPALEVWQFDYDPATANISGKSICIEIPGSFGDPDGMTIDREGMLWVAHWGGNCLRRWDPDTGKVLMEVQVDAPQVTSCCFGGPDLDILYITTARTGLGNDQLEAYPKSGGLFRLKAPVAGFPTSYFKIK